LTEESREGASGDTAAPSPWQQALEELEWSLRQATRAVSLLRDSLAAEGSEPAASTAPAMLEPERAPDIAAAHEAGPADAAAPAEAAPPGAAAPGAAAPGAAPAEGAPAPGAAPAQAQGTRETFDRLWDRIERERMERAEQPAQDGPQPLRRRGIDLLPQQYLMTVEDREGSVDLVPLHRALLTMPGVEEISLLSYANGVPVISVRTEGELDLELLGENVGMSMDRLCEVIPQENGKVYLRMKAREEQGVIDG
jgi:hypothetical protein